MSYRDLREWLERIEGMGELKRLNGAHWDQEIGAITDLARRRPRAPALLFDEIKDYPRGFRVLTNSLYSLSRVAVTARLPLGLSKIQYVDVWREKHISMKPILPLWVEGSFLPDRRFFWFSWGALSGGVGGLWEPGVM